MKKLAIVISLSLITSIFITINVDSKVYAATASESLDVNNDGVIDIKDLAVISSNYNAKISDSNYKTGYDFNGDGIIDIYDMTLLSKQIGTSVPIHVEAVTLNKTTDTLTLGDTDTLTAAVSPVNAANQSVTWISSNTSVATVDTTGKITTASSGTAVITATTIDGSKTATCTVTVNPIKGYVNNPEQFQYDLNVRSTPGGTIIGHLFNYQKVEITDTSNSTYYKIAYNNSFAFVSASYIMTYTSPDDTVVDIASNITKQFEVGSYNQIAGNFDGQGLSLGYLQWCIGQQTLQPLINRMDRQYNDELKSIFGTNYTALHNMLQDTYTNQLTWAKNLNDSNNKIIEPWYSQLVALTNNQHYISIEKDAVVYTTKQAMRICNKYNLKTVRGFTLAFDIVNQNGSISSSAASTIDAAIQQNPTMTEKELLGVIANAVGSTSSDVLSRKTAIVNGQGTVHGIMLYLDRDYGLSDNCWR